MAGDKTSLSCKFCGHSYPVFQGVPDFVRNDTIHSGQDLILEYYEEEAEKYNKTHGSSLAGTEYNIRVYYKKIFEKYIAESDLILEIGCGTGRFSRLLRRISDRLVSTDFSMSMIQQGLGAAPYQVRADSQALPFDDGVFDVCVGVTTFSYIPDKKMALKAIKLVLKPKGRIILIDMDRRSPIFLFSRMIYGKLRNKNHQEWVLKESSFPFTTKLLESEGFRIIEGQNLSFVPHVSPAWFPAMFGWADRLFSWLPFTRRFAMRFFIVAQVN